MKQSTLMEFLVANFGVFLQGIHGIKYFIYPIELLEAVNERKELHSKENYSDSRGGTDLAHARGEELNENNAAQEYKELNNKNVQLVENNESNEKNAEQVKNKEFNLKNSEEAETKEFNGKNAEQLEFKEFKDDNVTNNIFLRSLAEDTRIDALMLFLRGHMLSTNYFYNEVKRIKEKGVVFDSLRKMAAYLVENPKFKNSVLDCFHKSKVIKPQNVAMWNQSPNNLLIDVLKKQPY